MGIRRVIKRKLLRDIETRVGDIEMRMGDVEMRMGDVGTRMDNVNANIFLRRFREHYISVDLIRIGGDGDGGYLVPNILGDISHCFSPGVDYTSDFESHLSKSYNIRSFMADASVDSAPFSDPNFFFCKKFLGNRDDDDIITLSSWMEANLEGDEEGIILQMDIEGSEYDVLTFESDDTLKKFSVMVIEFHGLGQIGNKHFFQMFSSIFEKIYRNFSICHVHPNNCCGIFVSGEIEFPRVIEVTFLRNDFVEEENNGLKISLPHKLDRKNVKTKDDIFMPIKWWKD